MNRPHPTKIGSTKIVTKIRTKIDMRAEDDKFELNRLRRDSEGGWG
jgi:hypothetical protein